MKRNFISCWFSFQSKFKNKSFNNLKKSTSTVDPRDGSLTVARCVKAIVFLKGSATLQTSAVYHFFFWLTQVESHGLCGCRPFLIWHKLPRFLKGCGRRCRNEEIEWEKWGKSYDAFASEKARLPQKRFVCLEIDPFCLKKNRRKKIWTGTSSPAGFPFKGHLKINNLII